MGIKEWFFGGVSDNPINAGLGDAKPKVDEVNKEPEITFESDKELLERKREVRSGDEVIGCINKNSHDGLYEFQHTRMYLSMEAMIAITEKLKELNGCSDVKVEIAKLEQRLGQLEMTNTVNFTYDQKLDVAKEINVIRKRLIEISKKEYEEKQARQKGCVLCELEGRGLCAICKIGMSKK